MAHDILTAARKRRLARDWLVAALHEDFEQPDDEEFVECVEDELTRQWWDVWKSYCRGIARMRAAGELFQRK